MRKWLIGMLAVCLGLMPLVSMAALAVDEDDTTHYELPVDLSPGMPINDKFFLGAMEYEDPTLRFTVTKGDNGICDYWIADIEIGDASQLRTASADGFDSDGLAPAEKMAKRMNAVLAINGDYFSYKGHDIVIRQGVKYLNHLKGNRDVLVIDEDGDFHGYLAPNWGDIGDTVDGKKIINAFSFGPLLVNDGQIRLGGYSVAMGDDTKSQRMAIAQVGPLKYRVICCGPLNGDGSKSKGMTLDEFRQFVDSMPDVKVAYNLVGGDSTYLMINGRKINYVENPYARDIADIIYFASAYPNE